MIFVTRLARALGSVAVPLAIAAFAVPAAAATDSADLAQVQAHLTGVQSMTADFVQTDAKRRSSPGPYS